MKRTVLSAVIASTALMAPTPITAQENAASGDEFIQDVGAVERINYAGRMRMLTQRIAATACFDHAGIAVDVSAPMLEAATAEMDQILDALLYGDPELGIIGAETDRSIIADIEEAHVHWDPIHVDIADIIATGGTDEEVMHVAHETHATLEVAKHLVSLIVAEYSDPTAIEQADALTIDIAGRQRMLAQTISKDVCLISSGLDVETSSEELATAVRLYQASAGALRNGMAAAGVIEPPTDEIAAALDVVLADWAAVLPIIDTVMAGEELSDEDKTTIFNEMNSLTGQMNAIVGLYVEASDLGF